MMPPWRMQPFGGRLLALPRSPEAIAIYPLGSPNCSVIPRPISVWAMALYPTGSLGWTGILILHPKHAAPANTFINCAPAGKETAHIRVRTGSMRTARFIYSSLLLQIENGE